LRARRGHGARGRREPQGSDGRRLWPGRLLVPDRRRLHARLVRHDGAPDEVERQKGRLFRAVPIATARLGDLSTTPWSGKEIALLFHDVLGQEYEALIELAEIERLATQDIINGDIPILYQKAGILYYGGEGFMIGKLKEGL